MLSVCFTTCHRIGCVFSHKKNSENGFWVDSCKNWRYKHLRFTWENPLFPQSSTQGWPFFGKEKTLRTNLLHERPGISLAGCACSMSHLWFWYTKTSGRPNFAAIIAPFSHTRPSNDAAIWHRRDMFCTDLSAVVWFVLKYQNNMGVSKNRGFSPQNIRFNRVSHYFHHPSWGIPVSLFLELKGSLCARVISTL